MRKKLIKNIVFFLILFVLTFIFIISKGKSENILSIITSFNIWYLIIGVLLMGIFICCEAVNIKILLSSLGYKVSFLNTVKYASVGFFYSGITPSASGGQPMQIYHMKKDGIDFSHSLISLLIIICSFQLISLFYMVIGVIYNKDYLLDTLNHIGILFIIGILLNAIVLAILMSIIFRPKSSDFILKIVNKIINKVNIQNKENVIKKIEEKINQYKNSSIYIKNNKKIFISVILVTVLQFTASYSISFVTYKSFGFSELSYFKLLTLQAVLFSSISSIPLPGGIGISEIGYEALYLPIFGSKIKNAVLMTRACNFYIMIIITCIISIIAYIQKPKIARKKD